MLVVDLCRDVSRAQNDAVEADGSNPLTTTKGYYRLLQHKGELLLLAVKA
jgi:hypothetical protein